MTTKQTEVYILQELIPGYRVPFFSRLAQLPGFNLTVFCSPLSQIRTEAGFAQNLAEESLNYRIIPSLKLGKRVYQLSFLWHLIRRRPDLVVCGKTGALDSLLFLFAARMLGIKFLWWAGGTPFIEEREVKRADAGGRWARLFGNSHPRRKLLFLADGMIVYSEHARAYYSSIGYPEAQIFVAPNSPDTNRLLELQQEQQSSTITALRRRFAPEAGLLLLMIGRLDSAHRIDDLLRAVALLQPESPNLSLLLVGSGRERMALQQLSAELGLTRVTFVEATYDDALLADYLAACDILITPGGATLSIEMAMTFGKPVVSCDRGLQVHTIRDGWNGFVFPHSDYRALADRIGRIVNDEAVMREMGNNASHTITTTVNMDRMMTGFQEALESCSSEEQQRAV